MLNIGPLLAIRVAITKVVTFNIGKILLTGDALVRSVTVRATNWTELAAKLIIHVLTSFAIVRGLFP